MKISFFKPNDWVPVHVETGSWEMYLGGCLNCYAEVLFSPSRKRFKIKSGGHTPKEHPMYSDAVQYMLETMRIYHEGQEKSDTP